MYIYICAPRELIEDSSFHTDLERVQQEPVPYFAQFCSPLPSPHTPTAVAPPTDHAHWDTSHSSLQYTETLKEKEEYSGHGRVTGEGDKSGAVIEETCEKGAKASSSDMER